jgi:hypothetical protein
MLWDSRNEWFAARASTVSARRICCVVVAGMLASSCFLDETPKVRPASNSSSAERDGGDFVPPEPNRSNVGTGQRKDASASDAPGDEEDETDSPETVSRPDNNSDAAVPEDNANTSPSDPQVPPGQGQQAGAGAPPTSGTEAPPVPGQDAAVPGQEQDAAVPPPEPIVPPTPIHRYEFSGAARMGALDSIGNAHAELQGRAAIVGTGEVLLGQSEQDAVVLPPRLLNGLMSFTLLGWMTTSTDQCSQRFFEFIYYNDRNNTQLSALYLTPYGCPEGLPAVGYITERGNFTVQGSTRLADSRSQTLLGLMYDATTEELSLIADGVVQQRMVVPLQLRELSFASGALGRSSQPSQARLKGSIAEFRVYNQVLDEATLAEIARRGPDEL